MSDVKYRLVTRSDFDGLVCAVLLNELDLIDEIAFSDGYDLHSLRPSATRTTRAARPTLFLAAGQRPHRHGHDHQHDKDQGGGQKEVTLGEIHETLRIQGLGGI